MSVALVYLPVVFFQAKWYKLSYINELFLDQPPYAGRENRPDWTVERGKEGPVLC